MTLHITLLNIASLCFFLSEVVKLHRRWHARHRMDSTSLEGTILHFIGNSFICAVGVALGAIVSVITEGFLACLALVTLYWKARWLIKRLKQDGQVK